MFTNIYASDALVSAKASKGMRETRDPLRRRTFLVRRRAEALVHLANTNSQYNLPPLPKRLASAANRAELDVPERFTDPSAKKNVELDLALVDTYDEQIGAVELYLTRAAKGDDPQAYHRLLSVPGIGKVLALILLYEIHDIRRFPEVGQFLSYARDAVPTVAVALGPGRPTLG